MFNSRYSEPEQQQWHDACLNSTNSGSTTARHNDARTSMAKGQTEKKQPRTTAAMTQTYAFQMHTPKQDESASECLFDCYNG